MKWMQDGKSGEVAANELLNPIGQLPLAGSRSEIVGRAVLAPFMDSGHFSASILSCNGMY